MIPINLFKSFEIFKGCITVGFIPQMPSSSLWVRDPSAGQNLDGRRCTEHGSKRIPKRTNTFV